MNTDELERATEAVVVPCPECDGRTVMFRGRGLDMQYMICVWYTEPGHLSEKEIKDRIAMVRHTVHPSGRFA